MAAAALAVQPAAGAVMYPAVTVNAAEVEILTFERYGADETDTVIKDTETGKYSLTLPKMNGQALTTDTYATMRTLMRFRSGRTENGCR